MMEDESFWDEENRLTFHYLTSKMGKYHSENPEYNGELSYHLFGVNGERIMRFEQVIKKINTLASLRHLDSSEVIDLLFKGNPASDEVLDGLNQAPSLESLINVSIFKLKEERDKPVPLYEPKKLSFFEA